MLREVSIPLAANGRRDVKLSTIYQICPELFSAEITPLNDSTVTLPPKLGAMVGTGSVEGAAKNPIDSLMGFSPAAETLFAGFSSLPANTSEAGNPFRSPSPAAELKTVPAIPADRKDETPRPCQAESAAWPKEAAVELNPFASQGPAAQIPAKGNAFAASAAPAAQALIPAGFDASAAAPATGESAFSEGGIAAGFSGSFASFGSKSTSALFGVTSGAVTNEADKKGGKAFSGNPFESGEGFNTLFSKRAEIDLDIPFPTWPDPGPAAKSSEPADEPEGVWGAMFHGGGVANNEEVAMGEDFFSPPAFENIGDLVKQGVSPAAAPASVVFPSASEPAARSVFAFASSLAPMTPTDAFPAGFDAFEAAPELEEPAPAPEAKEPAPAPKVEFAAASSFPAFTPPTPGFAGFGTDTIPSPIDTFASGAAFEPPSPAPAPTQAPVASEAPAAVFEAAPASAIAAPAPARATSPAAGEASFDMRDLELRAIFSTSGNFTLSMVARRVVGLPGIVSCSLLTAGKLVQASKSEDGRIGDEAREMVATLRSLAKLTGLPEARNFTLHTERGIVSLFLEGDCCVMVHHEAAAFEPGVREKLILVARSLINLEE